MGHLFAHSVTRQAERHGILEIGKGFQLFRSRQIAMTTKFGAFSVGALLTALLVMLEAPIETIVGVLLPPAIAVDMVVDGAEVIILPLLIAAAVLPHLVRKSERRLVRVD